MEEIPTEIKCYIFEQIPEYNRVIAAVCKEWRNAASSCRVDTMYLKKHSMRVAFASRELFDYMMEGGLKKHPDARYAAAAIGTPYAISKLITNDIFYAGDLANIAALWGNYHTMTNLIKNYCYRESDDDLSVVYSAAKGGNLKCFEWLCDYMSGLFKMDIEKLVNIVCKRGHFEIFKFMYKNKELWFRPGRGGRLFTWKSAEFNRVNWLQWLREEGCEWDEDTPDSAAEHGSIDCLKFAIENGCEIGMLVYGYARKHPECKEYIEELVKEGKLGSRYLNV